MKFRKNKRRKVLFSPKLSLLNIWAFFSRNWIKFDKRKREEDCARNKFHIYIDYTYQKFLNSFVWDKYGSFILILFFMWSKASQCDKVFSIWSSSLHASTSTFFAVFLWLVFESAWIRILAKGLSRFWFWVPQFWVYLQVLRTNLSRKRRAKLESNLFIFFQIPFVICTLIANCPGL